MTNFAVNERGTGNALISRLRMSNSRVSLDAVNEFYEKRILFLRNHAIPADALQKNCDSLITDRSLQRLFHGLLFLHDFCTAYEQKDNVKYLETGMTLAGEWVATFGGDLKTPVHHDETTAVRMNTLIRLQILGNKANLINDCVREFLQHEATLLESDTFHATGNNHGMFQDLALLNYYEHIGVGSNADKAKMVSQRLLHYFKSSFTNEGVHKENSPVYHAMIHRYLKKLSNYSSLTLSDEDVSYLDRVGDLAEKFGCAVTLPNGNFIPWGDTPRVKSPYISIPKSIAFPNSGYAVFVSNIKGRDGTDIAVRCGFKASYMADYHKHSDDLSIFLYSNREVLTDSGAFGYNHSDERVKYAYSSRAHNTLTIPAQELPRIDGKYDCVKIVNADIDGAHPVVEGVNSRWGNVHHRRRVLQIPPNEFIVEDFVDTDQKRDLEFWWHLGEGLGADLAKDQVRVMDLISGEIVAQLKITSSSDFRVEVASGRTDPVVGWIFPHFGVAVPSTSIAIRCQVEGVIKIETGIIINPAENHLHIMPSFSGANDQRHDCKITNFARNIKNLAGMDEYFSDLLTKDVEVPYGRFNYPCRLKFNPDAQYLSVQLHGNMPRGARTTLPVFSRWNWGKVLGAHVLSICDPTLYLDDTLTIGWYLGDKDESAILGVVAIAERCADQIGIAREKIIYTGGSGGGFAALQAAALTKDGKAIAINPQTDLLQFGPRHVGFYVTKASGCASMEEAQRVFGDRWNAIRSLQRACSKSNAPKIVIVQNQNEWHHEKHFTPFAGVFGLDLLEQQTVNGNFMSLLYDGPHEHGPEPMEVVKRINNEGVPFLLGETVAPSVPDVSTRITLEAGKIQAEVQTSADNYEFACYLYKDGVTVEKQFYSSKNTFSFNIFEPGKYSSKGFIRNKAGEVFTGISTIIQITDADILRR